MYTAQFLYITSIPTFEQHYRTEALISEPEVKPAVWNILTPENRDRVKKALIRAKRYKYGITLSI